MQYLTTQPQSDQGLDWFSCPQFLYTFDNSPQDLETLDSEALQPYLALGWEFVNRCRNLDSAFEPTDKYLSAQTSWMTDSPVVKQFLEWECWDDVVPPLPGDSQRIKYAKLVVWPGPPPVGMPLQDIPRIRDCRLHHRAFYVNKTGRYLTHQEANEVTSLSEEERLLFFGAQLSEDPASSDLQEELQAPSGTQTSVNPDRPPGSPSWPTTMPACQGMSQLRLHPD